MKTRAFISWLIGAAVISTIIFSSVLYGEEPVKEYYKSGKLKSEGIYKDGKPEGVFKKYYENGQLESEVVFKKGQYDGLYKNYYENGQVRSEIIFKNGKFNGAAKTYYDDGELQGERIYKDDEYQESGKLQNEGVTGISLRIIDQAAFSLPKTLVKIKGETEAERQFLTKLWQENRPFFVRDRMGVPPLDAEYIHILFINGNEKLDMSMSEIDASETEKNEKWHLDFKKGCDGIVEESLKFQKEQDREKR